MAKNKSFKVSKSEDDFDLDKFLNSEDMVFDLDPGASSKKSFFKVVKSGVVKGIASSLKSPSFYKVVTKSVVPASYGDALDGPVDVYNQLKNLYADSVKDLKPSLQQIAKEVDKIVPEENAKTKDYVKKIKNLLDVSDDINSKALTPEQIQEQSVQNTMAQIFGEQAIQQAKEQARDRAQNAIDRQVSLARFNATATTMAEISFGIKELNAYNNRINQAYQKKSLELQLRSFFIQTDLLAISKAQLEILGRQNNEMIRLLSLPDSEKVRLTEKYQKSAKSKFAGKFGGLLANSGFYKSAVDKVKNYGKEQVSKLKGTLETALFGLEQYNTGRDMISMTGEDPREFLISMLTSIGLQAGATKLGSKYKDKILPPGSKMDNRLGRLAALLKDPAGLAAQLDKSKLDYNEEDDKTILGRLKNIGKDKLRGLLGILQPGSLDKTLTQKTLSLKEYNEPAYFTNKTQLSITEIIPGYLARILKEIQVLRTGDESTELTTFNPQYGRFMSAKRSRTVGAASAKRNLSDWAYRSQLEKTQTALAGDTKLTSQENQILRKQIESLASDPSKSVQFNDLLNEDFLNQLPKETQAKFRAIRARYEESNNLHGRNRKELTDSMFELRNSLRNNFDYVDTQASDQYMREGMRGIGLLKRKRSGEDEINMDRYLDLARDKGKFSNDYAIDFLKQKGWLDEALRKQLVTQTDRGYRITAENFKKILNGGIVSSDINVKDNVRQASGPSILDKLKKINVFNWKYKKDENKGRDDHMGPMAQEVHKHLGEQFAPGGKSLDLISLNGANMAAIKELSNRIQGSGNKGEVSLLDKNQQILNLLGQIEQNTRASASFQIGGVDGLKNLKDRISPFIKSTLPAWANKAKDLGVKGFNALKDFFQTKGLPALKDAKGRIGEQLKKIPGFIDDVKTGISNLINPVSDIYSRLQPNVVLLSKKGIEAGEYIDQKTGKIIKTLSDITGPVTDRLGNVVLTLEDMKAGLVDRLGKPIKSLYGKLKSFAQQAAQTARTALFEKLPSGMRQIAQGLNALGTTLINTLNTPKDIYIRGKMKTPVMYAKDIIAGKYVNLLTNKVIEKLSDITGPVIDAHGNYVVTEEDYKAGLVDVEGKPIVGLGKLLQNTFLTGVAAVKNKALAVAGKIKDFLKSKKPGWSWGSGFGEGSIYSKKSYEVLIEIRDVLKERLGLSQDMSLGEAALDAGADQLSGESVQPGSGMSQTASAFGLAKSVFQGGMNKLGQLKNSRLFAKGREKLGSLGAKLEGKAIGRFGSRALSKIGGWKGKLLGEGLSFLTGGGSSSSDSSQENQQPSDAGQESEPQNTKVVEPSAKKQKLQNLRELASNRYQQVRERLMGKASTGTQMDEINAKQAELEAQRKSRNTASTVMDAGPKYMGGGGDLFGAIKGKLGAFKGMMSKAFSFLSDIPGLGKFTKVLSKIPLVGKLFRNTGALAEGVGEAAEVAGKSSLLRTGFGLARSAAGWAVRGAMAVAPELGGALLEGTLGVLGGIGSVLATPVVAIPLAIAGVGAAAYFGWKYITRDNVDELGQVRMTQYGLTPELKKYNHYLLNVEKYLTEDCLEADDQGHAQIKRGALDFKKVLSIFGVDPEETNMVNAVILYMRKRFLPVFLANVSAVWQIDPKKKITDADNFSLVQKKKLLDSAKFFSGPYSVDVSPFKDLPRMPANLNWVKFVYQQQMDKIDKQLGEQKKQDAKAPAAKKLMDKTIATSTSPDVLKSYVPDQTKENTKIQADKAKNLANLKQSLAVPAAKQQIAPDAIPMPKPIMASAPAAPAPNMPTGYSDAYKDSAINYNKNTTIRPSADAIKHFDNISISSESRNDIRNMVGQVAQSQGISPPLIQTVAALESGFKPNAQAPTSSAGGLFQFINATWRQMLDKYGPQFNFSPNTSKFDPKASALMGTLYLKQNLNYIKNIKPNPNPTDAYLTHFLGPGGAATVLKTVKEYPNAILAQMMPAQARANRSLFYQGGNLNYPFTAAQFYSNMENHVNHVAKTYGIDISGSLYASGSSSASKETKPANDRTVPTPPNPLLAQAKKDASESKPDSNTNANQMAQASSISGYKSVSETRPETTASNSNSLGFTKAVYRPEVKEQPVRAGSLNLPDNHPLNEIAPSMGRVSDILNSSLTVQQQMLESLQIIAKQSPTKESSNPAGTNISAKASTTPPPKTAISLKRGYV